MSTSRRRVDVFEHHKSTNQHNKTHTEKLTALETLHTATNTKLDTIATNTANIQIEADAINLNTDELEAKMDSVISNTTGLNNCVSGNELQVDVVSGSVTATVSGVSTEAKQDALIAKFPSALSSDQIKVEDAGTQFSLGLLQTGQSTSNTLLTSLDTKASTRDGHLNNIVNQTSGLATESTLSDIDTKVGDRLPSALTTAGNLKVSIEESSSLTSLDNKAPTKGQKVMTGSVPVVIASNQTAVSVDGSAVTQPVSASSLPLPSGASTESTLGSLNGKITTGENDISAGTGAQQVLVYGKDAFAPFNLEPIRMSSDKILVESQISNISAGISNSLPVSDSKITQGYDSQVASGGDGLQQVLAYGRDASGNLDALRTDASGHLEVVVDDMVKGNTTASASFPVTDSKNKVVDTLFMSNESISASTRSTSTLDTLGYQQIMIYGEVNSGSVTSGTLKVQGSNSASGTYYHLGNLSPSTYESGRTLLNEGTPLLYGQHPRYIKIYNSDVSSASITLRAVMSNFNEYQ